MRTDNLITGEVHHIETGPRIVVVNQTHTRHRDYRSRSKYTPRIDTPKHERKKLNDGNNHFTT